MSTPADPRGPAEPAPALTLRLFGPFEVRLGGAPLPPRRTRKGDWLLALLVLRAAAPAALPRDWLAPLLWPDSPDPLARRNLRTALADLRRALGPHASRLRSPSSRSLSLDLAAADVDLLAFDAAISRGDVTSLTAAVALYRGPLLEGCAEEWVLQERIPREQACLQALETLATQALTTGNPTVAVEYLRRAVAIDPLRESSHRALMDALAAGGNHAAALLVYAELRRRLQSDLNSQPDPETTALFHRLRAQARDGAARGPRPASRVGPWPPALSSPPPPRAPTSAAAPLGATPPLPRPRALLLGREAELAAAQACLLRPDVGLLTLTGPGGVGKTRLALEIAARLGGRFRDGVTFVDLTPIRDPERVIGAIARALAVREAEDRPHQERVQEALRAKERLLLLDNFEQVIAAAPLVAELLAATPRLKVLATSRMPLRLHGEQEFPVLPLPLPAEERSPSAAALAGCPSVELFLQRARNARPEFAVTDATAPAIAAICRRLDGLPLAIELAAAWVKLFPPEALLARLSERLKLLVGGARDLPARQQTLRAAIEWSHDLLTDAEKRLFRRLSVFVGGFALEAAEAVCGARGEDLAPLGIGVVDGVAALVEKSLVRRLPDAEGGRDEEEGPRFGMLETIGEFGRERLEESGEDALLRRQHARFYLAWVEAGVPKFFSAERVQWLRRVEREAGNLQAALDWSRATVDAGRLLRLAGALADYWEWCGRWSEGRAWIRTALASRTAAERTPERARALRGLAFLLWGTGEDATVRTALEEAVAIHREAGNRRELAQALNELFWCHGDTDTARALLDESRAICRADGDTWRLAEGLIFLGNLEIRLGALDAAQSAHEEALAIAREIGAGELIAGALQSLSRVALAREEYGTARALSEESLLLARQGSSKLDIAFCLHGVGLAAAGQGDDDAARAAYEECLNLYREQGDRLDAANALNSLGEVLLRQRDFPAACAAYEEVLVLYRELGDREGRLRTLRALIRVAERQGDIATAARLNTEIQAVTSEPKR